MSVALVSGVDIDPADDDVRKTNEVVKAMPAKNRRIAGRCFVGFHTMILHETDSGALNAEYAVEGVASAFGSSVSGVLVVTRGGQVHDLSSMILIDLKDVLSMQTVRRF